MESAASAGGMAPAATLPHRAAVTGRYAAATRSTRRIVMPIRLFDGIRPLDRGRVLRDVLAGASTASINIPQVLGYARIAGAPVVTGLYTLILPLVAFAVFGSSPHLIVAAAPATAAIFSSSLSQMTAPAGERYIALVGMVTL